MANKYLLFYKLIFCAGILSFIKASTPDSPTYTVGVVETNKVFDGKSDIMLKKNMQGYENLVGKYIKKDDDVDIIIFPESTLNSEETAVFVPSAKNKIILCNKTKSNQNILSQLSCLASDYKKYMVFNIVEKENCTRESQQQKNDERTCVADGLTRHNTNVVFDRNGVLISRYRKWNLYGKSMINTTLVPEYMTFKTDFGVQFVSIVGFDILWWTPTMEFVKKGYKNFVHPIWWFSELPFLTANQFLQGWAYATNVNLLTSAGNFAPDGATGSAIFNGRHGPIVEKMTAIPTQEILIAKVSKSNRRIPQHTVVNDQIDAKYSAVPQRLFGLTIERDETVDSYANVLLKHNERKVKEKVCHGNFCCKFRIKRKPFSNNGNKNHYSYRLVAYSGPRSFKNSPQKKWMKVCAIIACTDDKSIQSCGKIFDDKVSYWNTHYFKSIKIQAKFPKQEKMLIMPNSVDTMFKPISVNGFKFKTNNRRKKTRVVMRLRNPVSDLLTFGIFADYYGGF